MPRETGTKTLDDVLNEPHKGHSEHMCELVRKREMDKVAKLSKNPQYICLICGRVSSNENNLCLPVDI